MHQSDAYQRWDEYRRYFPDWTRRSLAAGEELEANHNSYLAGGYAEEFGYLARPGFSRGVPLIDGEPPDDGDYRLVQRAGVHPGYPLRPHPVSVDREQAARSRAPAPSSSGVPDHVSFERRNHGRFVRVTERPYAPERRQLVQRALADLRRFFNSRR